MMHKIRKRSLTLVEMTAGYMLFQKCKGGESVCDKSSYGLQLMSIPGMEDAHAAVLDLDGVADSNAFFAVYDGHGGVYALQINELIMLI